MPAYYIFAHQDDWMLFRGHTAFADCSKGVNTVFICVTAGDGGGGNLEASSQRDRGMIAAIRLAVDGSWDGQLFDPANVDVSLADGMVKRVGQFRHKNTVSYFLRIKDGGNAATNSGTLGTLFNEGAPTEAVGDGSVYTSPDELRAPRAGGPRLSAPSAL